MERPIIFNNEMLRAILDGRKTQTRRVAKEFEGKGNLDAILARFPRQNGCHFGQPGDLLWVRETTINVEDHGYVGPVYVESEDGRNCLAWGLAPSPDDMTEVEPWELKLRPSVHMPRSMCRLLLEITDVRVERLHAISDADARAEGASGGHNSITGYIYNALPREHFVHIWKSTGGDWDSNPWVWVIEFKRVTP